MTDERIIGPAARKRALQISHDAEAGRAAAAERDAKDSACAHCEELEAENKRLRLRLDRVRSEAKRGVLIDADTVDYVLELCEEET